MIEITEERLFAALVYVAVSLTGLRVWDHFVGRTRATEYLFYAGIAAIVGIVLGIATMRVQQYTVA